MKVRFLKGAGKPDQMICLRQDGSVDLSELEVGCALHDLAHLVVESRLGIREGYFGKISDGFSSSDFSLPNEKRPFAISDEGFRAEILSTLAQTHAAVGSIPPGYVDMLRKSAENGQFPFPDLPEETKWKAVLHETLDTSIRWIALSPGKMLEFTFSPD